MALKDLTAGDFKYIKNYADDMKDCHEKEFKKEINPDLMRAMYRGRTKYEIFENSTYGKTGETPEDFKRHLTALSILFQATNTILPNVYYQNPGPIVIPRRNSDPDSAALMSAAIRHYMKLNNAKRQNQEAVLNAWFFGLGWKKIGYKAVFEPRVKEAESVIDPQNNEGFLGKIKSMIGLGQTQTKPELNPDSNESRETPQIADYETLYNDSESPMNIMLDHKADLLNARAILHRLPRTLYDLENYGNYEEDVLAELFEHLRQKNGSKFDSRTTELHLNEFHVIQRNGTWVCAWVDEFAKPLRYDKLVADVKGFLFEPLALTFEPGVRYPISHMKVASQVQTKLDDVASMFVELVARSTDLIQVNEKALAHGQANALEKNLLRGILKTKGPLMPGDLTRFSTGSVSNDLPNLIAILQQKVAEIVGGDQQLVMGKSKNETLGQDELARAGTKLRESGLRDRVRDWMIEQMRKEGVLIKQFSNAELHLCITGKDYANPQTGEKIEDKWVEFMTLNNPLGLKHSLQGEFDYDINIEEAIQPDKTKQRQAYQEMMTLAANPAVGDACLQSGFRFRLDKMGLAWLNTFDGLTNPEQFIEQLDSIQTAAIQTAKVMMQTGGKAAMPQIAAPSAQGEGKPVGQPTKPSSAQANG